MSKPFAHIQIPADVIAGAWESVEPNTTGTVKGYRATHIGERRTAKVSGKKQKKKTVKRPSMVLISQEKIPPQSYSSGVFNIVAFPRLEHSEVLERARRSLEPSGPSSLNPDAVATLRAFNYNGNTYLLDYIQMHAKSEVVPRKLITAHKGAQKRLLQELFEIAKRDGKEIAYLPKNSPLQELVTEFCQETGAKVREKKLRQHGAMAPTPHIVITPPHRHK